MDKSVRTVIGSKLQTAHKHNLPYIYEPNSVMNEQFGVLPDDRPSKTPWTQYAAIGIGGLTYRLVGESRRLELVPQPHDSRHTGMYEQIPFVIREVNDDLSTGERARFRLRRIRKINGTEYVEYYLRRLDFGATEAVLEYRTIEDGNIISNRWSPTPDDQHPVPMVVNPGQVLVTGDDYIAATAKTTLRFDPWDINELLNVGRVLYESENAITVSEIALVSGIDIEARGLVGGVSVPITEVVGAQITDFVSTLMPAAFTRSGASLNLDSGSTEPLLALRASN